MNSLLLIALFCTGAFASTMPVFNFDWLNSLCPILNCPLMRCPDGIMKRSVITLPGGKHCPACDTCMGNPLLIKRSILPFVLCPMVSCAMPTCDRRQWVYTTINFGGKSCSACPACTATA